MYAEKYCNQLNQDAKYHIIILHVGVLVSQRVAHIRWRPILRLQNLIHVF